MSGILRFRRPEKSWRPIAVFQAFSAFSLAPTLLSCGPSQSAQTSRVPESRPASREAVSTRAKKALALASQHTAVFEGVQSLECTRVRSRFAQFDRTLRLFSSGCIDNNKNRGPVIDEIQRTIQGVKRTGTGPNYGGNWCASFVQWLVFDIEKGESAFKSRLPPTRYAVQQVSRAPKCIFHRKGALPEPGWIVVWRKLADRTLGHTEIVVEAKRTEGGSVVIDSIGGNTTGAVGETDGEEAIAPNNAPQGIRPRLGQDVEKLEGAQLLGYVNPWIGESDECRDGSPVGEIP